MKKKIKRESALTRLRTLQLKIEADPGYSPQLKSEIRVMIAASKRIIREGI